MIATRVPAPGIGFSFAYHWRMWLRRIALLVFSALSVLACNRESARPDELKPGPIGPALTADQERRVRSLQALFADVDHHPPEKWIEDFRRDQHPDREIAIYEDMAKAYQAFVNGRTLTQDEKDDAYGLVLQRSMMKDEAVLQNTKLKALSMEEAREVLKGYPGEPAPILVKESE
jgi:hypothetical protein